MGRLQHRAQLPPTPTPGEPSAVLSQPASSASANSGPWTQCQHCSRTGRAHGPQKPRDRLSGALTYRTPYLPLFTESQPLTPPLPSPASAGSPGGEGSRGGSLGSGWSPSFPSGPHWAGSRAEGGQPRPSCPLPLTCLGPGTGSAREGEREGRGEREDRKSPSASISGHQCAVSFVSTVNVCV